MSTKQKIVVAAYIERPDEVLLVKRASTKALAPGKHHLPGGHVEFGEHPDRALAREIFEELGAHIRPIAPFFAFTYGDAESHTVGIVYRCELLAPLDEFTLNEESEVAEWIPLARVGDYFSADDHNLRAIRAAQQQ